ncbi:heat shock 70 kDa protein 12A-like [Erpetoichthys calabaricus]|uniref:Heat shock 70 kDa protein 12A-like n=1 Tax=Erpetoichthys calabaricus TaxID=27687 RepID=A0A8C4T7Y0_ERPCA|nr:heat shock 70 kDa protein 12A-like [Erpetoichthys calabaricus]
MEASPILIAIDFGTAFSSYCISVNSGHDTSKKTERYETETVILFNENQEFEKFGVEALTAYTKMTSSEASRYYFFQNFKMELYNQKITENLMISTMDSKQLPALKVFSESLRYLKDHALKALSETVAESLVLPQDVTWVLTVPAIWDNAAKDFMRQAAQKAGLIQDILSENLILALEPEAASVWCKQLPTSGFIEEQAGILDKSTVQQQAGVQYVVVDCGGGTVDITVHEVLDDGSLKELQKASGGGWGGFSVDSKFTAFLRQIFGPVLWEIYKNEHPAELQKMMHTFSIQKCTEKEDIYIECPHNLAKLAAKNKDISSYFSQLEGACWTDGNIKISYEKLASFFTESIKNILEKIKEILDTPEISIDFILLVGGYASSSLLREAVKREFGSRYKILCPYESQLAVAKGAVIFGTDSKIIHSRVSALTYGINMSRKYDPLLHDPKKRRVNKAGDYTYCTGLFLNLVSKGQSVEHDEDAQYTFFPVDDDQTEAGFRFFSTEKLNAIYIDEPGLKEIGSFVLPMPDIRLGTNREIHLKIKFGLTEIKANAIDTSSGEVQKIKLKFMSE